MTEVQRIQSYDLIAIAREHIQYSRRIWFDAAAQEWLLEYVVAIPLRPSIWRLGYYPQARKALLQC